MEQLSVGLVDLLDQLLNGTFQKEPMTDSQRQQNLKTARLLRTMTASAPPRSSSRWAYADVHWSTRIVTLYQLRKHYTELLNESRSPKRFKPRTEPHGTRYTPGRDKKPTDGQPEKKDYAGFATMDDLGGDETDEERAQREDREERGEVSLADRLIALGDRRKEDQRTVRTPINATNS